ncbi:MAG: DUF6428 family protein [Bacteroidia bacterium]|jgi:hypothetical protein|nr:DUF6428 family protein [Bacteroidia bacterium]
MTLSEIKEILPKLNSVDFKINNGTLIPEHFHVTEVGLITKHFIDCGGTVRKENIISFQLWISNDIDHRLKPNKLHSIISKSAKMFELDESLEIEVEYQTETIGKYRLRFDGNHFLLMPTQTSCLASDICGISSSPSNIDNLIVAKSCNSSNSCCT